VITVYNNPDLPYSDEDRALKRTYQKRGFDLLEDLAYVDRKMNDVRTGLGPLGDRSSLPSSLQKKIAALETSMEDVTERLMITDYGDLRGDERLREEVGFLYGVISFYGGRPTQNQMERMDFLEVKVRAMEAEVDDLLSASLKPINKGLAKSGAAEIELTSREAFDQELD
jgi:hypothetical protein